MPEKSDNSKPEWVDPDDAPELTDEDFARGVWFEGGEPVEEEVARVLAKARSGRPEDDAPDLSTPEWQAKFAAAPVRRGRPRTESPKVSTTIRLDADVVAHYKAGGPGWQTRINETLRHAAGLDRDR